MDGCGASCRRGSRAEDGGDGDGGSVCSTESAGTADEGVTGEEGCTGGLVGADVIEGRVGCAVLGGSGSGTDSLESADGWEGIEGGTLPILSMKLENRGDVAGFVVCSVSSSAGRLAESSGSDGIVGATNA
jgi:hypothetical protein